LSVEALKMATAKRSPKKNEDGAEQPWKQRHFLSQKQLTDAVDHGRERIEGHEAGQKWREDFLVIKDRGYEKKYLKADGDQVAEIPPDGVEPSEKNGCRGGQKHEKKEREHCQKKGSGEKNVGGKKMKQTGERQADQKIEETDGDERKGEYFPGKVDLSNEIGVSRDGGGGQDEGSVEKSPQAHRQVKGEKLKNSGKSLRTKQFEQEKKQAGKKKGLQQGPENANNGLLVANAKFPNDALSEKETETNKFPEGLYQHFRPFPWLFISKRLYIGYTGKA
jgi:hypothetical protein